MDNIDVRKYIISNFRDSSTEEIKASVVDSIASGDEDPLIGLGVMFELLWKNSTDDERNMFVSNIKKGMHRKMVHTLFSFIFFR